MTLGAALLWAISSASATPVLDVLELTSRDGLPQNSVTGMVQTPDGYLWVTTFGGLARYDGNRFVVFDPATNPELETARFLSITQGEDRTLWIGTDSSGVLHFDGQRFTAVDDTPRTPIWDLRCEHDTLWIASEQGTFRKDGQKMSAVGASPSADLLRRQDGTLWVAESTGPRCIDGPCGSPPPPIGATRDIGEDSQGRLYAYADGSIWRLNDGHWVGLFEGEGSFGAVFTRRGDELWAVNGSMLRRVDSLDDAIQLDDLSAVRSLLWDREDGLWVGLGGRGLRRVQERGFRTLTDDSGTVEEAPDGSLVLWNCGRNQVLRGPFDLASFTSQCGDAAWSADGRLWLTDANSKAAQAEVRSVGPDGTVQVHRTLATPADIELVSGPWIEVDNEVFRPEADQLRSVTTASALGEEALSLVRGGDDAVWVAGASGALYRVGGDGKFERMEAPPVRTPVRDVWQTPEGTWTATYGSGMHFRGTDGTARALAMAQGLCDNAVSRILPTGDGFVWLNTNRGAGRMPAEQLEAYAKGRTDTVQCELLGSWEANGSGGRLIGGELILPTIHGTITIDPSSSFSTAPRPGLHIAEASYGRTQLTENPWVQGPSDLFVAYDGLSFDNPRGMRFQHRLVGHSDTWSDLTSDRTVRYLDLPPGHFRFEVRAKSPRGGWSDVQSIAFERAPLWWETWYARILFPALLVAALLLVLGLRARSTLRQNAELRRQVEQRLLAEQALRDEQQRHAAEALEVARARRLESLATLAGGVANDFNNLLMVILGRMELLRLHADPEVVEDAMIVTTAAEKASEFTHQLLAFGKRAGSTVAVLDLAEEVEQLEDVLNALLGDGVVLHTQLMPGVHARLDRSRLEQILTNLVENARDAVVGAGRIDLEVLAGQGPDGPTAVIVLTDDGPGIDPTILGRIFEPYFTTKPEGAGTGLGLAAVHGAVKEADGDIFVESTDEGTRFEIRFPRSLNPGSSDPVPEPVLPQGLRVLLVDDNEPVRRTVEAMLHSLGAVTTAYSACADAIEAAKTERYDLLITDVQMPDLTGPQLARKVLELQRVGVLYISGHTAGALDGMAGARVLLKPFTAQVLAENLLELLTPYEA